jgi:predicted nucleotidyltransferase component of viral defense system
MHREAIPDPVWRLLLGLSGLKSMQSVYLGGGTALAIQLGHRVSADLDFFVPKDYGFSILMHEMLDLGMNATVISQTPYHSELIMETIKVDYLRERISPRFPLKTVVSEGGRFQVVDPADIGRMKLLSIASRGSKKDFIDLYCLTRRVIPLEELLTLVSKEQGAIHFNRLLFLKGLVDFEEAEKEAPPIMLWEIDWNKVKEELGEEVRQIGRKWS